MLRDGTYCMYLRKSRADVEKERYGRFETLAKHEEELTELARRGGYVVGEVYRELVSGESLSARTEFQKVIEGFRSGAWRGVIAHDVSRLGRGDPMEYGYILQVLKTAGALIVTPGRVYDTSDPDDLKFLKMQMFVSNMELDSIRERLASGSRASARQGQFIMPIPPYGYDKAVVDRKHTLVPNDCAPVVRSIFEKVASGVPCCAVARSLNESGVRSANGGRWTGGRITAVIRNPVYKGEIVYGATSSVKDPTTGKRSRVRNGNPVRVAGLHEPIVDAGTWEKANTLHVGEPPVHGPDELKNAMAGVLVCAACGRSMNRFVSVDRKSGRRTPWIRHAPESICTCKGALYDVVYSMLMESLERYAEDIEISRGGVPQSVESEIAALESAIARESGRLDKLIELYYADAISIDEFRDRRKRSEDDMDSMTARLANLRAHAADAGSRSVRLKDAIRAMADGKVPPAKVNAALKSLIDRVEYMNLGRTRGDQDIRLDVYFR